MKEVTRYDFIKLDRSVMTPQGFLRVPVRANRTGIQLYRMKDGSVLREYRPAEEVFKAEAMDSLKNCPITNDHPSTSVTPENAKELMVGMTTNRVDRVTAKDDDGNASGFEFSETDAVITDAKTIKDIEDGKEQASMGYRAHLDFTPGEFNGQKYDCIQRNIVHNHLAIVDRARGGPKVRLRLDSEAVQVEDENPKESDMKVKIKIGDKEFEVDKAVADAITESASKADELQGKVDGLTSENEKLKSDAKKEKDKKEKKDKKTEDKDTDNLQGQVDALKAENEELRKKTDGKSLSRQIRERAKLDRIAKTVFGDDKTEDEIEAMDNMELMKEILKVHNDKMDLEGKSDEYVKGVFASVAESISRSDSDYERLSSAPKGKTEPKEDEFNAEEARAKAMERSAKAWEQPIGRQSNKVAVSK